MNRGLRRVVLACLLIATDVDAQESRKGSAGGEPQALECGDLFYDDVKAEKATFFCGGQAGEDDHFLGVRFELADFELAPGSVELTGSCVSNRFDFSAIGGPWPNEVFFQRDNEGLADIDNPQRRATMLTGYGVGAFELDFETPWRIDKPTFWIMVRGDPIHAGEDFNVESDQSSEPTGNSWLTDRGLSFIFQTGQNLMIRANVRRLPVAASPAAVPTLGVGSLMLLGRALLVAVRRARRPRKDPGL